MKRRSFLFSASGSIAALSEISINASEKENPVNTQQVDTIKSVDVVLKGITWATSRGYNPLVVTAKRYEELHPGVRIHWEYGYDFAHGDLNELSKTYDLLMIDHPHVGSASKHGYLVLLNDFLPSDYLKDQADNSVGRSHESYQYDGKQWGLATDVATPVPFYRPDIIEKHGLTIPKTWDDVLELTRRKLAFSPCDPTSSLMNFFMMVDTQKGKLFQNDDTFVDEEIGVTVLRQLREVVVLMPQVVYSLGTSSSHEYLVNHDDVAYCILTYPYCNYSRRGYAKKLLLFSDLVTFGNYGILHSTLGGAGLAVSAHCRNRETAVDYIAYATSPEIQRSFYFESGGQPGHRLAWLDDTVNLISNNFFKNTLKSHDHAFLRYRYNGYIHFQRNAGKPINDYFQNGGNEKDVLKTMNEIYRESKKIT